jgi:stage V sporulation protein R
MNKWLVEKFAQEAEKIAKELGLVCLSQEFEWVTEEEISRLFAREANPFAYFHWSHGKTYRLRKILDFSYIYEFVLPSDPCIAYLIDDIEVPILITVIAHVYGHNDFFSNNLTIRNQIPLKYVLLFRRQNAERIEELQSLYGVGSVERVLDAARCVRHNATDIYPLGKMWLEFFLDNPRLEDWEREIISIVCQEAKWTIPLIRTKLMNEGWASFWQMEIVNRSSILPLSVRDESVFFHSQLTSPLNNGSEFNVYNLGLILWRTIKNNFGLENLFSARRSETDVSFLDRYFTPQVADEAGISLTKYDEQEGLVEIPPKSLDQDGWNQLKSEIIKKLPSESIPVIFLYDVTKDETLVMKHFHDGRDLNIADAVLVLKNIATCLWKGPVIFITRTVVDEKEIRIFVSDKGNVELRKI